MLQEQPSSPNHGTASAWLTRPILDFDITRIDARPHELEKLNIEFSDLVEKTFKRYEESNSNIDSFRLRLQSGYDHYYPDHHPWILKALQLGATRLDLRPSDHIYFDLPDEVFGFESENLVSLALEYWKIYDPKVIACSMLQTLRLDDVKMQSAGTIFRVISSCPLLRKLSLCNVCVDDDETDDDEDLVVRDDDGPITIRGHGLRSLTLEYASFETSFMEGDDLSLKFPHLKKLTLISADSSWQETNLNISSPSLERLHIGIGKTRARVKLNVSSIRRLSIGSPIIPKLSIKSNSTRPGSWESYVRVGRYKCLSALWFRKLNKYLTKFTGSKIHLTMTVASKTSFDYEAGEVRGLTTPEIEKLTVYHDHLPSISCLVLFDGLFRICRPKMITQYIRDDYFVMRGWTKPKNVGFLGKKLLEAVNVKVPTVNMFMYGLNDLKEARAEVFDDLVSTWRDAPLDALSDETTSAEDD